MDFFSKLERGFHRNPPESATDMDMPLNKLLGGALICVSSDMPACGILSHVANLGCSECKKKFSGGVDICNQPERNIADYRKSVKLIVIN